MAHRVGSNSHHRPEKKQGAFGPRRTGEPAKVDKGSQNDKSKCRNNMEQRESCMRRKCGIVASAKKLAFQDILHASTIRIEGCGASSGDS